MADISSERVEELKRKVDEMSKEIRPSDENLAALFGLDYRKDAEKFRRLKDFLNGSNLKKMVNAIF